MNDEWLSVGSLAAFVVLRIETRQKSRDPMEDHGQFAGEVYQATGDSLTEGLADALGQTIRRWANG